MRPYASAVPSIHPIALFTLVPGLLVGVGLSIVIFNFGTGSPAVEVVPSAGLRRLITGFLFGSTGALIALSMGRCYNGSGAQVEPEQVSADPAEAARR